MVEENEALQGFDEHERSVSTEVPEGELEEQTGVGDNGSAADIVEHVRGFLTDFNTEIQKFADKPVAADIYEPIYNVFYGLTFNDREFNSVATQGFAAGILIGLFLREDYAEKPDLSKDMAMHYAASFWDALNTTLRDISADDDTGEDLNDDTPEDADA